jgi:hypothetical protein
MIGVRVTEGDLGGLNGVTVDYRLGHQRHTEYFPYAVVLCVEPLDCADVGDAEEVLRGLKLLE